MPLINIVSDQISNGGGSIGINAAGKITISPAAGQAPTISVTGATTGLHVTQTAGSSDSVCGILLADDAANSGRLLQINHSGAGAGQAYGLDIHNFPGAKSALVIHQYSQLSSSYPAIIVDNCGNRPFLKLNNTENQTLAPGQQGTGDYFEFHGYTDAGMTTNGRLAVLDKDMKFRTQSTLKPIVFTSDVAAPALTVSQGQAANGLYINQTAAGRALYITATAGSAGFWPILTEGQNFGPKFVTTTNSGQTLTLQKDGTGAGEVLYIVNKGTGRSVMVRDASAEVFGITATGLPVWVAGNTQTTVGAAGAASALPANPTGYLKVDIGGTTYAVAYYAAA